MDPSLDIMRHQCGTLLGPLGGWLGQSHWETWEPNIYKINCEMGMLRINYAWVSLLVLAKKLQNERQRVWRKSRLLGSSMKR